MHRAALRQGEFRGYFKRTHPAPMHISLTRNIMVHHFDRFVCEGLMTAHNFELHQEEAVMFERPHVVVTNRRLLVVRGMAKTKTDAVVPLGEVGAPTKLNGGQQSRVGAGAKLFGGGAAIFIVQIFFEQISNVGDRVGLILFVTGFMALLVGGYFLIGSFLGAKPNTLMIFPMADGEEVVVRFPDWDNPEADELTRQFARAKRAI